MRSIYLAELRDSWSAWLGVSLVFVATNFALALAASVCAIGFAAVASGQLEFWESSAYTMGPAFNIGYCAVVGAVVIGSATSLVVDSRRGSLARLALAGATPKQVVSSVLGQLVVVSLACAVVGDLLAMLALQPTLVFVNNDPSSLVAVPPVSYDLGPALAANALAVAVAVVGGLRTARAASRIPPVEALRQSVTGGGTAMSVPRWIGVGLAAASVGVVFGCIPLIAAMGGKETFSNMVMSSMIVLILGGVVLALAAPVIVGPLTRAWTALVPTRDPVWMLARNNAVIKAARLTKSVVPVMIAIGLLVGLITLTDVMLGQLKVLGISQISGVGLGALISFLGLPLIVALSGGLGSLIMMGRQRDAELALSGIVGTTPAQRVAMTVLEGVIIAVTGTVLALVMVALSTVYLAVAFPAANLTFALNPSFGVLGLAFGFCLAITVAATVLPTLRSIGMPEPKVIARLVAE